MSSEAIQQRVDSINRLSTLITKLTNFQAAIRDFDRLRLDGAGFLAYGDEAFNEYQADKDSIRALACGPAGDAVKAELNDPMPIEHLCHLGEEVQDGDLSENELRAISAAMDRAVAKAQDSLNKVLFEE